jgi:hypothetical protein
MATPTESVQEQHKAWLERMTTVLGEFCANSKSIAWMLELMQRKDAVDAETTRAIREGLAQNLEEGAEVEKHRQFIQSAFPERQQRASVVSNLEARDEGLLQQRVGRPEMRGYYNNGETLVAESVSLSSTTFERLSECQGPSATSICLVRSQDQVTSVGSSMLCEIKQPSLKSVCDFRRRHVKSV